MSVFFNGQLLISPTTASAVDDSGMANKNLTVGNIVALIGRSEGGKPASPIRFGSPDDAKAVLRSGDLLDAVLKAFDPSAETNGPAEVVAFRVNPAVAGALALKDNTAATVVNLAATDYGLYTNQIKVKVEAASVKGKKITAQLGNDFYTKDNIFRDAFSVRYTGAGATATMAITNSSLVLSVPTGTPVATIDLNVYNTVEKLVDRINSVADFTAITLDGNNTKPTLNGLDSVAAQDVKSATYTVAANLQAIVDWFNGTGEGFITATRAAGAGTLPVNIGFTYLSGGSDGNVTTSEWAACYSALQSTDVQWVVPITSDPAIHAMNDTHCAFMSTVGKSERRGIVGTASNTSDADAIAAAKALNSDRTSLMHIGFYDYDAAGTLVLKEPYIFAALVAGAFSGVNPGTPLTNKAVKVRGLERDLRNPTDTDQLILGGVLCVENTKTGYKVVQSISTWLVNDNYNRVEVSTGVAVDHVARNVREALDPLRGKKGSPLLLQLAISYAESRLKELARAEPEGPGIIVGDADNPAFRNLEASLDADVLRVKFECHPAIGVNYVLVNIFATPFSGTATA